MQSFFKYTVLFFSALLLTACGSERDTPFNPSGGSSSSAASIGNTVIATEIYRYDEENPEQPAFIESTAKQIIVINTEDEFEYYWDIYKNGVALPTDLDFEEIQVVILDLGNIGNCTPLTQYRNIKANEYTNNTVLIRFNYRESSSSSSSSSSTASSCDNLEEKRPFYFYSIESRKKILIDENVTYE